MTGPPQTPDLNPIEQIWGELENKLDRSIDPFGLSCRRQYQAIFLRKYIDTMSERYTAVVAAKCGHQILKLKVDKNSTTHFIWYLLCSEQPSACFSNILKLMFSIFSDMSGFLIILATTVYFTVNNVINKIALPI